jgi:hypothetical protein
VSSIQAMLLLLLLLLPQTHLRGLFPASQLQRR